MAQVKIQDAIAMFDEGTGFGDPDARRNAELQLQVALAQDQKKTAQRLNLLTLMLVVVTALQVVILSLQYLGK